MCVLNRTLHCRNEHLPELAESLKVASAPLKGIAEVRCWDSDDERHQILVEWIQTRLFSVLGILEWPVVKHDSKHEIAREKERIHSNCRTESMACH